MYDCLSLWNLRSQCVELEINRAGSVHKHAGSTNTTAGAYITKDTILAIYDQMAEVIRANREKTDEELQSQFATYHSPLEKWAKSDWPTHIHSMISTMVDSEGTHFGNH